MWAVNKMENVRLLKVWSSNCERLNQLGDVQKRIILKIIVEPVASNVFSKVCVITECLCLYVSVEPK